MSCQVFISHAPEDAAGHAPTLLRELERDSGLTCYAPSAADEQTRPGEVSFSADRARALLDARLILVVVTAGYFEHWACLRELRAALTPALYVAGERRSTDQDATDNGGQSELQRIVLVLPDDGTTPTAMQRLPRVLREQPWPRVSNTAQVTDLVRERLQRVSSTLSQALESTMGAQTVRDLFSCTSALPPRNEAEPRSVVGPAQFADASLESSLAERTSDLWKLDFGLWSGADERISEAPINAWIQGPDGMGKTRLALEYVYRFAPSLFPQGVVWIDARADAWQRQELHYAVLKRLSPGLAPLEHLLATGHDMASELAKTLAANNHDGRLRRGLLCVVDNLPHADQSAPDAQQITERLRALCPAPEHVSLLAITHQRQPREPTAAPNASYLDAAVVALEGLGCDSAVSLLTAGLDSSNLEPDSWCRIAEWVGGTPLASVMLNRSLTSSTVSATELLAIAEEPDDTPQLKLAVSALRGRVAEPSLAGVTRALLLCYERLSGAAQRMARLLGHLAPAPIPSALSQPLADHLVDGESPGNPVEDLIRAGFVIPASEDSGEYLGQLHRVVADLLVSQSQDPASELLLLCDVLKRVLGPDARQHPQSWPLLNSCLPHAARVLSALSQQILGEEAAVSVVELGLRMAALQRAQGRGADVRSVDERLLRFATDQLGAEHDQTLACMGNLALTLHACGDLETACDLQEKELEIRRHMTDGQPLDALASIGTLSAMNNLALTLKTLGDGPAARELQQEVLNARVESLGEEHPATLSAMGNLASTLHSLGNLEAASALQKKVLDARKRHLGPSDPSTLSAMRNLAVTLISLRDAQAAVALQREALEIQEAELGEEHPDTVASMGSLALALVAQGDMPGAQQVQERVLEIRRQTLGNEHPDTVAAMRSLAVALQAQSDLERAQDLQQEIVEITTRTLGGESPQTLLSMNDLAAILYAQGDLAGAREIQQRALDSCRKVLGDEHPHTLACMNNLAVTLQDLGDLEGARILQQKELDVCQRVLGPEHPDTLTCMSNLASILKTEGDLEAARKLQETVLETRKRVLGDEHPETLTSMNNLASMLKARGDLGRARKLQEQVVVLRKKALGVEHPETLTSMHNLASIFKAEGKLKAARKLQEAVLEIRQDVLGPEHPDTLTSMNNLASIVKARGDYKRARELEEQVLDVRTRVLGMQHPATTISAWNLVTTLLRLEGKSAALPAIEDTLLWLVQQQAVTLTAQQRRIREMVLRVLEPGPSPSE